MVKRGWCGGSISVCWDRTRCRHWIKNLLVFVPVLATHHVTDLALLRPALIGFLAFSLAASAAYPLNDLLDLQSDRQHPEKRLRPLASGALPIHHAFFLAPALLGAALGLGFFWLLFFRQCYWATFW